MKMTKIYPVILFFTLGVVFNTAAFEFGKVLHTYHNMPNEDAKIVFTIYENRTFDLIVEIININSENDLIEYEGNWVSEPGNYILIRFDPVKNRDKNPKYLFADREGNKMPENNNVELIDDYTFKLNLNDNCVHIWNIKSCKDL
jgi:hypothetical protein